MSSRLFTLHTDQLITAPYSFSDLAASKNVYLQGLFNEIYIKRLALGALTRDEEIISGNVNASIARNAFCLQSYILGNFSFSRCFEYNGFAHVSGNVHFTKGVVVKNLEVRESLNGINVAERLQDAIRLQDSGVAVTGTKTFLANSRFRNLNVDFLNSVDLDDFLANVVTRNAAHRMSGAVTVRGVVSAPRVTAQDLTVDVSAGL